MSKEAEIRVVIDRQLTEAGWSREKGNLVEEQFLPPERKQVKEAKEIFSSFPEPSVQSGNRRFADYVLLGTDGKPLALVEAKKDDRSPHEGTEQAAEYAERIARQTGRQPFIYLSNGNELYFWERDTYPPRKVSGFHTVEDLTDFGR